MLSRDSEGNFHPDHGGVLNHAFRLIMLRNSKRQRSILCKVFFHWKRFSGRSKLLRDAFIDRINSIIRRKALLHSFHILRLCWLCSRFQKCFCRFQELRLTSKAITAWKAVISYRLELRRRGRLLFEALNQLLLGSLRAKTRHRFLIWRIAKIHDARLKACSDLYFLRTAMYRCNVLNKLV